MREIKFRAWSTVSKKMIKQEKQGAWFDPNVDTDKHKNQSLSLAGVFNEETLIVEQYTGLKDKSGVEIYEGDIFFDGLENCAIEWNENTASFLANDGTEKHDISIFCNYEVIGNIHENPELLSE